MAQGKLGRDGWVRARALSTAAQQTADPVGSATRDYANNRRTVEGDYPKAFPSIHAWHDVTQNLKARLSWSSSFGRPPFGNIAPGETPNEANPNFGGLPTLTINNPSLLEVDPNRWTADRVN